MFGSLQEGKESPCGNSMLRLNVLLDEGSFRCSSREGFPLLLSHFFYPLLCFASSRVIFGGVELTYGFWENGGRKFFSPIRILSPPPCFAASVLSSASRVFGNHLSVLERSPPFFLFSSAFPLYHLRHTFQSLLLCFFSSFTCLFLKLNFKHQR